MLTQFFEKKTRRSDFPLLLYFQVDGNAGWRITYCHYYPTIQRLIVNCDFCNIREILRPAAILEIFKEESLWNRDRIDYLLSCRHHEEDETYWFIHCNKHDCSHTFDTFKELMLYMKQTVHLRYKVNFFTLFRFPILKNRSNILCPF